MDKRKIFVAAFFLLAVSGASAWEEANPNAVRVDRKEIKVEKALQGVYLKTELLQCFSNSVSLNMGYFREDRLAPTFTLRTLAGLCRSIGVLTSSDKNTLIMKKILKSLIMG